MTVFTGNFLYNRSSIFKISNTFSKKELLNFKSRGAHISFFGFQPQTISGSNEYSNGYGCLVLGIFSICFASYTWISFLSAVKML